LSDQQDPSDKHDAIARLIAEAAIGRTLARYCHTIDDRDFEALGECFTEDAELEAFGRTRNGREAVVGLLSKAIPPENRGKHLTCNTFVSEEGEGKASAVSDFAFFGKDSSIMTGRYIDQFVAADDGWRIAKRTITLNG
jgi:3-phenylpropionate/cinnamic acid dioxygenase small subunit